MVTKPYVQINSSIFWAEPWLPKFLAQLDKQDYPKDHIRYAFSCSPSPDNTMGILLDWLKNKPNYYLRNVASNPTWSARERMWTAGNYHRRFALDKSPETWQPDFIFNCDCDVIYMPTDLISYLVEKDVDIIHPYIYVSQQGDTGVSNGTFYDSYGFRFLNGTFNYTKTNPPHWADWYKQHISLPEVGADMEKRLIPMYSVGANPIMYKREVLEAFTYTGGEAIFGFCKEALKHGFKIWSTPDREVVHSYASIHGRPD